MDVRILRDRALHVEQGKRQVNVADASEFMRALNSVTAGAFYKWIHSLPKRGKQEA
jgi:hypothetical protein